MFKQLRNWSARLLPLLSVAVLAVGSLPQAIQAQEEKPVVVIAINKLSEITSDIGMMTELAGQGDAGKVAIGMAGIYTNGIDKTKPAGGYVAMTDAGPKIVGFIPVTNLKAMLGTFRDRIGTPKEIGDGVLEVGADRAQPMYVKEHQGYAFIAQDRDHLAKLPDDPTKALVGLDKKYDIAVRLNMENIPAEFRDLIVSNMRMGFDQAMRQNNGLGDDEQKAAEAIGKEAMKGIIDFIEQSEQMTIGFAIDAQAKNIALEFSATARDGTDLAKEMAGQDLGKSLFGGLVAGDPAARMHFRSVLAKSAIEQYLKLIAQGREQALKEIDNDTRLPDQQTRDAVKASVEDFLDVAKQTVEKGKLEAAGAVHVSDHVEFLLGGHVADGLKIEKGVKRIVELVRNLPGVPTIKLDVASHNGVNIHTVDVPVFDPQAAKVIGEQAQLVLGFGKDAAYLGLGSDGVKVLKSGLDAKSTGDDKIPAYAKLMVGPFAALAAKVESNPQTKILADAAKKSDGNDHVLFQVQQIERGSTVRIEFGSGLLQMIGEVSKAAQGGN
ncbi:MAG: hypothetical protein ACKOU6_07815 [Planctomycetota bacterium]